MQKEAAADIDKKYHLCLAGRRDREVRLTPPPPPHCSSSMQFKLKSSVVIKFKLGLRRGPKTWIWHKRECAERTPHRGSRFMKGSLSQPVPIHSFIQPVCLCHTKAFWHLKKWIKTTERGKERRKKINYSSFFFFSLHKLTFSIQHPQPVVCWTDFKTANSV